jgi:hypothetical protein
MAICFFLYEQVMLNTYVVYSYSKNSIFFSSEHIKMFVLIHYINFTSWKSCNLDTH